MYNRKRYNENKLEEKIYVKMIHVSFLGTGRNIYQDTFMTLLNKNEHLSCSNYANEHTQIFSFISLKKGEIVERKRLDTTFLVFIIEGRMEVRYDGEKHMEALPGKVFLLPGGKPVIGVAQENSLLLLCAFSNTLSLCSRFSIQQLSKDIPSDASADFYFLSLDDRLSRFLSLLVDCLQEGLGCIHFHQIKREELFLYLRASYSKESLARFFYPILGKDMDFKDFILTHSHTNFDVKYFATQANMSLSTFNRHFKETFQDIASNWLLLRKQEFVKNDIIMTSMSLAEIAEKYHFSSTSYLVTFCKKYFGKTPNELRKDRALNKS